MTRGRLVGVAAVAVVLILLALLIVLRLPVVSLVAWEEHQIEVTDLERSTLVRGDIYLELERMPSLDLVQVSWQWCPGWHPLSWCLQLQARDIQFDGRVSLGLHSARIRSADISLDSLAAAGIDPNTADLHAVIRIEDLRVRDRACPVRTLEILTASAEFSEMSMLGSAMGEASLVATATPEAREVVLIGDNLSGSLASANSNDYSGSLLVRPPPAIEPLFEQFVAAGPDGQYQWRVSGAWPCGWS